MSNNATYPSKLKGLLVKAGLIGTGILEVRSLRVSKTVRVAEAYEGANALEFEKKEIALDQDVQRGWTSCVKAKNGSIAGYWANGLTKVEQELINTEAGVPYFYLGDENNKDTQFSLFHGKEYDMSVPAQAAEVRCLLETTVIGHNKQDAMDLDCEFYFYSKEEAQANKKKRNSKRRQAVALVETLNVKEKREVLRMMHYLGSISIDPYLSEVDAELSFDDIAYDKPLAMLKAYEHPNKYEHIMIHALRDAGAIELGGDGGPYYKSAQFFGAKTMIAETLLKCYKAIKAEHELLAMFKRLEKDNSYDPDAGQKSMSSTISDLLKSHLVTADEDNDGNNVGDDPMVEVINKSNRKTLFKMIEDAGLKHEFDENSDIKDIRKFCIENVINGN